MPVVVPHKHCIVCGKVVETDQVYCSDKCKMEMERERRRQRNFMIFMIFLLFIFLAFIFLTPARAWF
jgi:predicted nucleic acid-binding Zn ribbon protein